MLLRIVAPHFVAGFDTEKGYIAPIIRYMKTWSIRRIAVYCQEKGWNLTDISSY
jgi:hypothetical protein